MKACLCVLAALGHHDLPAHEAQVACLEVISLVSELKKTLQVRRVQVSSFGDFVVAVRLGTVRIDLHGRPSGPKDATLDDETEGHLAHVAFCSHVLCRQGERNTRHLSDGGRLRGSCFDFFSAKC